MKKILFLLTVLVLTCLPWTTRAQNDQFTLFPYETGNNAIWSCPVWGYNLNYGDCATEFIIPTRYLDFAEGATFTKMRFYIHDFYFPEYAASVEWNVPYRVYLSETEATSFRTISDTIGRANATLVFSGNLNGDKANRILDVVFDTPYQYHGGNLVVGFWQNDSSSVYAGQGGCAFVTTSVEDTVYWVGYTDYDHYDFSVGTMIPKITFDYYGVPCLKPRDLQVYYVPGSTTAQISWVSDASDFEVEVNGVVYNFNDASPNSEHYYDINVVSGTEYTVRVKAHCNAQDESDWSLPLVFLTAPQCEVTLELSSNSIYGWDFDFIEVWDNTNNLSLGTYKHRGTTPSTYEKETYTVAVSEGQDITFRFPNGYLMYPQQCSWIIIAPTGDTIAKKDHQEDFTGWEIASYNVSCSACYITVELNNPGGTNWDGNAIGVSDNTEFLTSITPDYNEPIRVLSGHVIDFYWMDGLSGSSPTEPYSWTIRDAGGNIIAQGANYNSLQNEEGIYTFIGDCSGQVPSSCDITFELTDSDGDGWNGNAIEVWDATADTLIQFMANENLNGLTGYAETGPELNLKYLTVQNGQRLRFQWKVGRYAYECSWVITGPNGERISVVAQGEASNYENGQVLATYTVNCGSTPTPTNYCQPAPTSVDGDGIVNVSFGTGNNIVNNSSYPTSEPYYGDYSSQIGAIAAGTIATVDITYNTCGNPFCYNYGTIIWVDWNNNKAFEDNEIVFAGMSSQENNPAGVHTLNATFPVSANQTTGDYRMRIGAADTYFDNFIEYGQGSHDPCNSEDFVVFHDYTLRVIDVPSCPPVTDLQVIGMDPDAAQITWTHGGNEILWDLYWTTSNVAPTSDTVPTVGRTPNDQPWLAPLTPNTHYYAYVRARCSDENRSQWSPAVEFTTPSPYTITFNAGNGGTATVSSLECGGYLDLSNVSATPTTYCQNDWTFIGWSETPVSETTNAPTLVNNPYFPTRDTTLLYAVYQKVNNGTTVFNFADLASENSWENGIAYTPVTISPVTITANGGGNNGKYYTSDKSWRMYNGGSVSISASGANVTSVTSVPNNNFTINAGTASLNLTATTKFTSITVEYEGTIYNSNPVCAAPSYTITYLDGNNILDVDTFEVGANVTLIPDPTKEGYTFLYWSPALPATMPDHDIRAIAQWQIDTFTVTATANVDERGVVTGAGRYVYNSQVEMRAEANQGYLFNNWTDAQGTVVSTDAIFDFVITHDTAFTANFISMEVAMPTILPESAGTVFTEPVSVSIRCETENAAIYYTLDGSEPTANSILYTGPFTLTENATVKAIAMKATMTNSAVSTVNYTINIPVYTVSFHAGGGSSTTSSASGNVVNPIDWSNITASPSQLCANDWTFVGWSVEPVSETNDLPVLVSNPYVPTGDVTLYAVYQKTGESVFDNTVGGQFTIYAKVGNTKYYATETESADKLNSTTTASDATIFTFEQFDGYEDGEFAIKSGNTYIKYSGSSTNLGTSNNPYKWRFSPGTKGTWRIESQTNGRALIFRANNFNTFKGYSTNNVNGTEYYDIEIGGTATYIYNSNPVCVAPTYTITYLDGNDILDVDTFELGATITPIADPTKVGYTFTGWEPALPGTMPDYDFRAIALWQANSYNITINQVTGGTISVAVGNPDNPTTTTNTAADFESWVQLFVETDNGYTFNNFEVTTIDGIPIDISNNSFLMPAEGVNVTANFELAKHILTINYIYSTSGNNIYPSYKDTLEYGESYSVVSPPENDGFYPSIDTVRGVMGTEDITISVSYLPRVYQVTLHPRGGMLLNGFTSDTTYTRGQVFWLPTADDIVREGYSFGGWFRDTIFLGNPLRAIPNSSTGDWDLYAKWDINDYIITYLDGNDILDVDTFTYGANITPIADPTKEGYTFTGWNPELPTTMPAYDVRAIAQWTINKYALTYMDGNEMLAQDSVDFGAAITPIANPTKEGYTFTGWNPEVPQTMPANDVNIQAVWQVNSYDLTINQVTGGTITVNVVDNIGNAFSATTDTSAAYNASVQLSVVADAGYTIDNIVVTTASGDTIETPNNGFSMPAEGVIVSITFTQNTYTVTAIVDPENAGTVTGTGTYNYNDEVILTAIPAIGYNFGYWQNMNIADNVEETDNPLIFNVFEDVTYKVFFTKIDYELVYMNGEELYETVTYNYGDTIDPMSAPEKEGYTFIGWTPAEPVTMPAYNDTLYAQWQLNSYTVTANVNPANAGTVTGAGTYNYGNEVEMRAEAAEGYLFTNWTNNQGEVVSTNAIFDFEIANDTAFTANFTAMGVVATPTFSPAGGTYYDYDNVHVTLECSSSGATIYYTTDGSTPTANSTTYSSPITITENTTIKAIAMKEGMTNSEMATATYVITPTYTVTIANDIVNGIVRADASRAAEGETVNLTAIANNGYHLSTWAITTETGTVEVSANNSFAMPAGNVTISATFEPNGHTITYYNVSGEIMTVDTFAYGDTITPIAAPSVVGYTFTGWYPALPTTMPDYDLNTMAHWQINRYRININQVQGGIVQAIEVDYSTGETIVIDSADYGSWVQISAITNDGCTYNDVVVTDANGTVLSFSSNGFTMPASDVTVTPRFTIQEFTITYGDRGNIFKVDTFAYGANITPIADPTWEGHTFIGWDPALPITMPAHNLFVDALWQVNSYKVTVTQVTGGTITINYMDAETYQTNYTTTDDSVYYGAQINLRVVTDNGYNFNSYVVTNADGSPIAITNNSYFMMPANDVTISASFDVRSYELTINYFYQNGTEAAPSHTDTIEYNTAYSVASPVLTGYTASQDTVMGVMGTADVTVDVIYSINSYNITVNQVEGGTITVRVNNAGANGTTTNTTAEFNSRIQLTVATDNGYTFNNFVVTNADGTPIETPNNGFYMPANDVTVTANISVNNYTITYQDGNGNVIEVDTLAFGANITPIANPTLEGYTFTGWDPAIPTTMPAHSIAVSAQWQVNSYNITINQVTGGTITVTENNIGANSTTANTTAAFGSLIQLSVSTNNGYTFNDFVVTNADGTPIAITNNSYFMMPANDVTVTANFTANEYTITYLKDYEVLAVDTFACGDTIIPIADPTIVGFTFIGWQPALPTTMPAYNMEAHAQWQINSYRINIAQVQGGSVQATQVIDYSTGETIVIDSAEYASWVQLSAVANDGYTFYGIVVTDTGGTVLSTTNNGFAMPASDVTVTATFTINHYTVTTTINPENAGTISGAGTYNYGTEVTLTATPATGYSFDHWQNMNIMTYSATETANPLTFTLTGDIEYKAFFTLNNYTITYKDGNTVLGVDTFAYGATITPMADPTKEGYTFTGWDTELPTTMPANDLNRVAQWQVNSYRINIDQVQGGNVQATNGTIVIDSAAYGSLVHLSIVTNEGCIFNNLVVTDANGTRISVTDNSFYMPASDVTITPSFTIRNYTITYIDRDNVLEVDTFACGSTIIPMADPTREGYTFTGWDPALPTTMPANDLTVDAQWQINSYNITINQVTGGTITVSFAGESVTSYVSTTTDTSANFETWIQLSEVTEDGYTFVDYLVTDEDGEIIETPNNGFIMPASDVTVTATYTVNNYTITYMDGNSILAQDTVAFNATITPIANPTREGYTFIGWDPAIPATMPAYDLIVYAQWQINSYNITINQVTGGTITVTVAGATAGTTTNTTADFESWIQLSEVTLDGYTFGDFVVTTADGTPIETPNNGFYMPANDVTVTANISVNNYTITYQDGNGNVIEVDTLAFGANITPIANPTLEGYTFTGWDPAIPATMPAYDLIVYAQWQINSYNITINQVTGGTITVTVAGATAGTTTNTTADFESWIQLSEVTLDGYTFGDFVVTTADGSPIAIPNNGFIMPAIDVTVTAIYTVNNYTITYMDGNSILAQDTVAFGATVTPIANPTKEGYTFTGWDPALPTTMPANDLTVDAQWQINSYNITINQVTGGTITVSFAGESATSAVSTTTDTSANFETWIQLSEVTEDGYTFVDFLVTDEDGEIIETPNNGFIMPAIDVTVTAIYTVNNYIITYMDGNSILAQDTVAFGATVTPIANPTKEGYTFTGWDPELPTTMPANDLTVNAQWQINSYNITINQVTGGTITATVSGATAGTTTNTTADYNSWINLDVVTSDGYTFNNFVVTNTDGTTIEIINNSFIMPANDVTVTATFSVNNYTITYMDGNSILAQDTVAFGATVTPIDNPTKEGYTFTGWDPALPTTMPANDLTVDAQWQINSYDITINQVTGGTITVSFAGESVTSYVSTTTDTSANFETWIQLSEVTEDGYTFVDFLVTDEDGEIIETPNNGFIMPAIDVTVTAIYTVNNYIITYMDGNSILAQDTVAFGATVTPIANPTKEGYTFTGWDPELPTTMPANDLTVNAQWQINSYDITINQVTGGTITVTVAGATAGTTTNTTADFESWIQLSADADYGYDFVDFVVTTASGDTLETPNNGFIMPAENVTVTAAFTLHNFNISVNVSDDTPWGTVTGSGSFAYGSTDTLTATADEHYIFVGWSDYNTENPRVITVTGDSIFTAYFIPEDIEIISDDTLTGSVNVHVPGGHLSPTTPIVITAVPEPHYHFVSWSDGNTDNPRTIMPIQAIGLTAIFAIDQHTITVLSNDGTMGEVDGDGTFDYGSEIQIFATAFSGYVFVSWNDGNTENPRTITVEQDSSFTAIFQLADGINDASMSNVNVYSYNNQIVIANAEGFSVEIFDISGRLIVSESKISQSVRQYTIGTDGIYVVKVGDSMFKKVKITR